VRALRPRRRLFELRTRRVKLITQPRPA
jgi:hypothetical protein